MHNDNSYQNFLSTGTAAILDESRKWTPHCNLLKEICCALWKERRLNQQQLSREVGFSETLNNDGDSNLRSLEKSVSNYNRDFHLARCFAIRKPQFNFSSLTHVTQG